MILLSVTQTNTTQKFLSLYESPDVQLQLECALRCGTPAQATATNSPVHDVFEPFLHPRFKNVRFHLRALKGPAGILVQVKSRVTLFQMHKLNISFKKY